MIPPGAILLPKALDVLSEQLIKKQKIQFKSVSDTQNTTDQENSSELLQWSPVAAKEGFEPTFTQYTDKISEGIEARARYNKAAARPRKPTQGQNKGN